MLSRKVLLLREGMGGRVLHLLPVARPKTRAWHQYLILFWDPTSRCEVSFFCVSITSPRTTATTIMKCSEMLIPISTITNASSFAALSHGINPCSLHCCFRNASLCALGHPSGKVCLNWSPSASIMRPPNQGSLSEAPCPEQ